MLKKEASLDEIIDQIVREGQALSIRDVDNGEDPFVYSTGNRGPGYLMIKGLVGNRPVMNFLVNQLALKVAPFYGNGFDFIEGNATGGMVPAWELSNCVEKIIGLKEGEIPYAYIRGTRKQGGHGELITGVGNGSKIKPGMEALIVEELVNYAGTTTNAAQEFRAAGFPVRYGATILFYGHQQSKDRLNDAKVEEIYLIDLPTLLERVQARKMFTDASVNSYKDFLRDPLEWQLSRGYVIPGGLKRGVPEGSAKTAIEKGYKMKELQNDEAFNSGAPSSKINEGVVYWQKIK